MEMINIETQKVDLSKIEGFTEYYNSPTSYIKQIIDEEINKGLWFDITLYTIDYDCQNNAVVVDIGANIGLFSLYVYPKAKVIYAIEPTLSHFKQLRNASDLYPKIKPYNLAIHNWNGTSKFFLDHTNSTGNHISETGTVETKTKTLLSFFKDNTITHVDLLKMDIEGGEKSVILLDRTIDEALLMCDTIFIETHLSKEETFLIVTKIRGLGYAHKTGDKENSHYFTR